MEYKQMELYQKYLQEYQGQNKEWDTDAIRSELKALSIKIKAGIKTALEVYREELPHMISLSYSYEMGSTWIDARLWSEIYTKEENV